MLAVVLVLLGLALGAGWALREQVPGRPTDLAEVAKVAAAGAVVFGSLGIGGWAGFCWSAPLGLGGAAVGGVVGGVIAYRSRHHGETVDWKEIREGALFGAILGGAFVVLGVAEHLRRQLWRGH